MTRIVLFLLAILAASLGMAWLAENPGTIAIEWLGYRAEPTVFQSVVALALLGMLVALVWSLLAQIWSSPAAVSHYLMRRRQRRGLDALSSGMIAIGAGDRGAATRYALQARKSLPNEPLTHLLRAQAAQLSGDKATARRIFEAMLASPDTEQLGLRGLYVEATREREREAQRQFAERALRLNPKLGWSSEALFELQCQDGQWSEALETLSAARRHGHIEKSVANRRSAVLMTAQAQALEDQNPDKALTLAMEAHALAPGLVPAAAIAGRLFASRGNTAKAAKVLQKTWAKSPHPDLATAYAYARIGDSPRDRLDRVKQLAALNIHSPESPIAVAQAAIEARQFGDARHALQPLLEDRLTRRVATLMARIEGEQHGDKGRVREWLARAVHAPRDPAWTADGVVLEQWAPVSPVIGQFDACQWRVPVEEAGDTGSGRLADRIDDLMALGAGHGPVVIETDDAAAEADASDAAPATVIAAAALVVQEPPKPKTLDDSAELVRQNRAPARPETKAVAAAAVEAGPVTQPVKASEPAKAAPAAAKPASPPPAKGGQKKPQRIEPQIFVNPPAPDDPGAGDDGNAATNPQRARRIIV